METAPRILEHLNTAVLLFDDALCIDYINPAGEVLFQVSTRHVLGQGLQDLLPGESDFIASLRRAVDSGRSYTEYEVFLRLPNRREVTVDITVTPLQDPHGKRELLLELLHIDRHLRIAREEHLITQNNNTRMLMRGMAHEINNPLGGLRGAAQLLDRELPDDTLREYTQVIIGEADRLQSLLSRMLGPNTRPIKRQVNIHEIVERVRTLIQAEAGPAITIARDYDPSIPDIHVDPDQLIQALLNVTRNALQALDGNGGILLETRTQRRFTIGQKPHRLIARINIVDTGPGIPPGMQETIFYPMITSRPEGTGLGLPIAQSIVNQHGGMIECNSQPGKTTFSIMLPLGENHEQ